MPDIHVGAQIFDVCFHPSQQIAFTGLVDGHVKAFKYDDDGDYSQVFDKQVSKKSCRGLALDEDGAVLYAVGRGKGLQ